MIAFLGQAYRRASRLGYGMALLLALVMSWSSFDAFAAAPGNNRSTLWDTCRKDDGEAGLTACMAIINTRGVPAR
jgi:hypothetical protein